MSFRITKVDWAVINAALAYFEAAGCAEEEMGDTPPQGFRSWEEYAGRVQQTREKVWTKMEAAGS